MTPQEFYVLCAGILILNLLFLANGTGLNRARAGKMLNPEDKKLNKNGEVQEADEGLVARYRRAHLNALENILPFLAIGFLFVMSDPGKTLAFALIGVFTAFRLVHSFAYIKGIQPWRTLSFAISAAAMAVVTIYTMVQAL